VCSSSPWSTSAGSLTSNIACSSAQVIWVIAARWVALAGLVFLARLGRRGHRRRADRLHKPVRRCSRRQPGFRSAASGWAAQRQRLRRSLEPLPGVYSSWLTALPWLGVMAAGYGFGRLWLLDRGPAPPAGCWGLGTWAHTAVRRLAGRQSIPRPVPLGSAADWLFTFVLRVIASSAGQLMTLTSAQRRVNSPVGCACPGGRVAVSIDGPARRRQQYEAHVPRPSSSGGAVAVEEPQPAEPVTRPSRPARARAGKPRRSKPPATGSRGPVGRRLPLCKATRASGTDPGCRRETPSNRFMTAISATPMAATAQAAERQGPPAQPSSRPITQITWPRSRDIRS